MWSKTPQSPVDPEIQVRVAVMLWDLRHFGSDWKERWIEEAKRARAHEDNQDRAKSYAVLALVLVEMEGGVAFTPPPRWPPSPPSLPADSKGMLSLLPTILKLLR